MTNLIVSLLLAFSLSSFGKNDMKSTTDGKDISGFKLVKIEPGSVYEKLGLKEGDLIKKINGKSVKTQGEVQSLFSEKKKNQKTEIVIERMGKEETLTYTIK